MGLAGRPAAGARAGERGCLVHTTRKIKLPFTGTRRAAKAANLWWGGDLGNLVWDMLNWEILRSSSLEVLGWQLDLRVWSQRVRHVLHG